MDECQFFVILFKSSSYAVQAERTCRKAGINVRLVPVPRELSSDCGICMRIHSADREATEQAMAAGRCDFERILPFGREE